MRRRSSPSVIILILAIAVLPMWLTASGFKFSDLFVKYRSNVQKTPAATSVEKTPAAMRYKDAYQVDSAPSSAVSEPNGIDPKLYVQESVACYEIQDHAASVKAMVDNYDQVALFQHTCFLYNALVGVWEKNECINPAPVRIDCCAEISGRYFHYFQVAQNSSRWNACAPWLFSSVCPRMNAFKEQCDAMQCSQNCLWGYACSSGGFEQLVRSITTNNYHAAETETCVNSGRKWITP